MTDFRTVVRVTPSPWKIGLGDPIFTIGSCFATAIGSRLGENKFSCLNNPFGVAYNPLSIHKALRYAIFNEPVPQHTFIQNQDVFLNYDFHSQLSSTDKSTLEKSLTESIGISHYFLREAKYLIITYGTSWTYQRNDTGETVSNCHKMPASLFTRSLVTQKMIIESFEELYTQVKKFQPQLKIILTVSPVRHVKDTLELNSVSKSILRLTCHTLSQTFSDVVYFPAYEIMMDDLRDYRFYNSDMIHPTEQAEDYIWEKFSDHYFTEDTRKFLTRWKDIRLALNHKPFHPESASHQRFLKETLRQLEELKGAINVDKEIQQYLHAYSEK